MPRIAVFAAALAFLVAADREGRPRGCGTPLANAAITLVAIAMVYVTIRIVIFGVRHPT
jgi:hypothetical protein